MPKYHPPPYHVTNVHHAPHKIIDLHTVGGAKFFATFLTECTTSSPPYHASGHGWTHLIWGISVHQNYAPVLVRNDPLRSNDTHITNSSAGTQQPHADHFWVVVYSFRSVDYRHLGSFANGNVHSLFLLHWNPTSYSETADVTGFHCNLIFQLAVVLLMIFSFYYIFQRCCFPRGRWTEVSDTEAIFVCHLQCVILYTASFHRLTGSIHHNVMETPWCMYWVCYQVPSISWTVWRLGFYIV